MPSWASPMWLSQGEVPQIFLAHILRASMRLAMRLGAEVVLTWKWHGSTWRTREATSAVESLQQQQTRQQQQQRLSVHQ